MSKSEIGPLRASVWIDYLGTNLPFFAILLAYFGYFDYVEVFGLYGLMWVESGYTVF